ncbi:50S ribosomal protein L3 [Candidatus Woesearchaeota archaeon]|nr:50S ribosomal protein L3 [Candidatus Woesearchaeota archaeon]
MPNKRKPRSGSLQFWPRKRAKRSFPRLRNFPKNNDSGLLGFAGYKVGMTHIIAIENNKNSPNKGNEVSIPVTIIECPPIKIAAVRFYNRSSVLKVANEIWAKPDKELAKKLNLSKKKGNAKKELEEIKAGDYDELKVLVYTQPRMTTIGKKKPELFELALGGNIEEQFNYAKENLGKEIIIEDVFKEGELTDIHAVTKGKGFQGPVKRFGIAIRQHKSEKAIRNPGSLGPWQGHAHIMWRVPHAGKMGYHQRTEYNKQILKISKDVSEIEQIGGFLRYGKINNTYLLMKGSIPGTKKRFVAMTKPMRPNKKVPKDAPVITYISKSSKQGI